MDVHFSIVNNQIKITSNAWKMKLKPPSLSLLVDFLGLERRFLFSGLDSDLLCPGLWQNSGAIFA